ncbi:MAG: sel1 repeat family protein, partial [Muribaculaceae bacterium]|nr:sel1 repeat family protein [Muribaculaceae bacterium]
MKKATDSTSPECNNLNLKGKAREYYLKAIEGDAEAQLCLGDCYYEGDGMEKDYTQAVFWYFKAAEQGNVDAAYNLGVSYSLGEGVEQ